jgi:hypothetical protein
MEEVLLELAKSSPIYAILLYWIFAERKERLELSAYCRQRQSDYMNVILRLVGKGKDVDELT